MPQQTEQQRQNAYRAAGITPPPAAPKPAQTQPTPTAAPIHNPTPAASLKPSPTPDLPQPQAPAVQQSYFNSIASDIQNTRTALKTTYDRQTQQAQTQLDTLKQEQQDALKQEQGLSQPFQQQLEDTQRQQLHVNENFEANQHLANELESLVNEAQGRLSDLDTDFVSKSYSAALRSKTLSDLTARAGLIQSAMVAYNGQIGQAYTMIDRSINAINADRKDSIDYYDKILDLNNQGILSLSVDTKQLASEQREQVQKEADDAKATADTIKQAMLDPDTAQAYALAGVTLLDTPEQINQKLSDYAYSKELSDTSKDMAMKGFSALLPGQSAPVGAQAVTITDSKGKQKTFYKLSADSNSSDHRFTSTQLNNGASNAGVDLETFKGLPDEVQNLFIANGDAATLLVADVADVKSGAMDYQAALDDINAQAVPQQAKDYFIGLLGAAPEPEEHKGFFDWLGGFFS